MFIQKIWAIYNQSNRNFVQGLGFGYFFLFPACFSLSLNQFFSHFNVIFSPLLFKHSSLSPHPLSVQSTQPLCHLSATLFTFYFTFVALSSFPSHAFFLPFSFSFCCSVLPPYLRRSLSLLPLSSVPRGYYLSRRQICPIINLISSFSHLYSLSLSRSLTHSHTQKHNKNTSTQAKNASLFCSSSLSISSPRSIHTFTHHPSPPLCHTLKSQLYTLPPFSSSLLLCLSHLPCHCHTDLELTTTKRREQEERGR